MTADNSFHPELRFYPRLSQLIRGSNRLLFLLLGGLIHEFDPLYMPAMADWVIIRR